MKIVLNANIISKKDITKKIINTKIHTIGNQGIIMNKYKFKDKLSDETKSVTKDFLIDENLNKIIDIIENTDEVKFILLSDDVSLLQESSVSELNKEIEIDQNASNYFTYPNAFSSDGIKKIELQILDCVKEINGLEFAKELVNIKKSHAIKNFDINSAIKFNDNIAKLQEDINKLRDNLKGIILQIKIIEDEFIDDFNRLVVDVKEKRIDKNVDIDDLNNNYSKVATEEYRMQGIVNLVTKSFKDFEKGEMLDAIKSSMKLQTVLGGDFDEVLKRLDYVGTDI